MMTTAAPPRARSLAPREHGAYGQLGVPLVVGLASGCPGLAAVALAIAAVTTFLAHEPALVLAGHRGARVQRDHGDRARRRLAQLTGVAAVAGGLGLVVGDATVALAAGAALVPASLAAVLVWRGQEKTLPGEVIAACALAGAAVPVAVAGGLDPATAAWAWATWSLGFAAVTVAVRDVIARGKRPRRPAGPIGLAAVVATAGVLATWVDRQVLAGAPLIAIAVALAVVPASPRRLRQIGWGLVIASLLTGGWLVLAARL